MNAQEAEAAYRMAKGQLDARQITLDEFNRRVAEMKYQDNTGTWWAVSPQDGSWLKWNGAAWVPAFAQQVPVTPQAPAAPVQQQAYQPPAQQPVQPAAQPSWYVPPVGSQPKPAAQPAAAQPVYQQPVQQPATPSWYIPPAGAGQQPAPAMPQAAVQVPGVRHPWSMGKKLAAGSVVLGIISWIFYPYIMGILAIVLGAYSAYTAKKTRGKIEIIAIAGIIIALASIIFDYSYVAIISPDNLPPFK